MTYGLDERLEDIVQGRVTPAVEDIPIGSARRLSAAVLVFDIRGFSQRTSNDNDDTLKNALLLLDTVLPMVAHVVYDHGGYVEKNTGDGVLAVIGAGESVATAAWSTISVALSIKYVIDHLVNDYLTSEGVEEIHWRVGIDWGTILLARIGTPKGSAKQARSFLTSVGPTANIATRLQQMAKTDEIWIGDNIKKNLSDRDQGFCTDVTPSSGWTWTISGKTYRVWHYRAQLDFPK